jgi:hypothetical protein
MGLFIDVMLNFMLKTVGLADAVSYRFSKWDSNNQEKYIGDNVCQLSLAAFVNGIQLHPL